jgi:hypothetical protein
LISVWDSLRKLGVVNFLVFAGLSKSNDFAGETTISIITTLTFFRNQFTKLNRIIVTGKYRV